MEMAWPTARHASCLSRCAMHKYLLVLLVAAGACSSSTDPSDQAQTLALSRARWNRSGIANYQFTIARLCECTPESVGQVVVEVRGGEVSERKYASGITVDPQYADLFTDVPGLFDLIDEAIRRDAAGLAIRYNTAYGYPESIQIDWVAGAVDDEISYRISDFTLLSQ
jgi:hypothetical protein